MDLPENLWRYGWLWVFLLNLFVGWVAFSFNRKFVTRREWETDREKFMLALSKHEQFLKDMTEKIKALPSWDRVNQIELSLEGARGDIRAVQEAIARLENQVTILIRGHLEMKNE
jgi:hypothetical protein